MFDDYQSVWHAVENGFGHGRVLVVGDLMLDKYLWGEVGRVSPEAPVLVVRLIDKSARAGGAGNVILNLAELGLEVSAAGFVADDEAGRQLLGLLDQAGVDLASVVRWTDRPTITKTRVIGGHQQIVRLDEEDVRPVREPDLARLLAAVDDAFQRDLDAVILSDYAKGALSDHLCASVIQIARERGIPVLVDPKGRNFAKYRGATTLTPNRHELEAATGVAVNDDSTLRQAAARLLDDVASEFLVVTRGEQGISLFDHDTEQHFPAMAREVFDVSGAGDTVIAVLSAARVAALNLADALRLANLAAGVVVGKVGTLPIQRDDLLDAIRAARVIEQSDKECDLDTLVRKLGRWRARKERVVFTNGCFDLLHAGHISLLERARALGARLVVGLNSDRSVRGLKGDSRPVNPEGDRMRVLAALGCVDAVILFDEATPLELIRTVRPDVLVKGGDYAEHEVVGGDFVKSEGGKVVLIPLVEGRSTTRIVSRLKIAAGA